MTRNATTRYLLPTLIASVLAPSAIAATIHVAASCGDDAWTGQFSECTAPTGPKQTIQAAIAIAFGGDTVLVQPGVYPGPIDFDGKAITLVSTSGFGVTVLTGAGGVPIVRCDSGEGPDSILEGFGIQLGDVPGGSGGGMYVSHSSPTITGCRFDSNRAGGDGGGLYLLASNSVVTACRFTSNHAEGDGGAVYISGGSVVVDDCTCNFNDAMRGGALASIGAEVEVRDGTFLLNQATFGGGHYNENSVVRLLQGTSSGGFAFDEGGGIRSVGTDLQLAGYSIEQNRSQTRGGGLSHEGGSLDISDCSIAANVAVHGGGVDVRSSATVIADTIIGGNRGDDAIGTGGGLCINTNGGDGSGSISVVRSHFIGNHAGEGGAVHVEESPFFATNCLFEDNFAPTRGGALYSRASSSVLTNCTAVESDSASGSVAYVADGELAVRNAILWSNTGGALLEGDGAIDVQYSDVEGGYAGTGNINVDPVFVDPRFVDPRFVDPRFVDPRFVDPRFVDPDFDAGIADYRIAADSPCIDAADNDALARDTTTDLDAAPRFIDDRETTDTGTGGCPVVDMGAYEYAAGGMLCCDGDIDGNDDVGFNDILRVLRAWGNTGGSEDVDGSGTVEFGDIMLILERWGPCV